MKKLASTTAALVLAAAASTAFATDSHNNQNGNGHSSHGNGNGYGHNSGECRETPQNPRGECPPRPTTPTPQPTSPVTNNNTNSNNLSQQQQAAAHAAAAAAAAANANANVKVNATGGNAVSNASGGNGIGYGGQGGQGGNGGQGGQASVTTGPTSVKTDVTTGATTLTNTDNSRTTQNATLTNTDNSRTTQNTENTTTVTDKSQNNSTAQSSGNNVNVSDNSRTVYKAAANRAAPDAAAIIGDGSCKTGTSFSLGVGTLDVNIGGSIASNKGWSNECADHELRKMEMAADAAREASLRASEDVVEKALAHEQAKQSSGAYAGATATLENRIEQMSVNGQPVEVKNWHALGGLNVVVKKPVVVTVAPTVAPEAACQPIVNVYLQAAQAARSTGRVTKIETPKTGNTTCDAEVAKALKNAGVAAPKF